MAKLRPDGGEFGRDFWTFSHAYVPPVESPALVAKRRLVNLGLLLPGLAALAAGGGLYLIKSPPAARAQMRKMLIGSKNDKP